VSHFSTALSPNQLMEPILTGPDHVPDLDLPLLLDLGWRRSGADLTIDVFDFPDPVPQGGTLTYAITVRNNGAEAATNVILTDTLPAGVTLLSATASLGSCTGTAPIVCSFATLPSGAQVTVLIQVLANELGSLTHSAAVSGDGDRDPANNGAVDLATVNLIPAGLLCDGRVVTVVGSEGDDAITGTPGPDVIHGLGGSDIIDGLDGGDRLCGGPGRDALRGGPGADRLFGQVGLDRLNGGPGVDRCDGGSGRDRARSCERLSGAP
jgi:uncharacterized repeat protein (TIGR01451 family)